ncbi:MAG: hypothetical protein PWP03_604 [Candidatus Woesearchaeota archaeon]|nr:hypothetical protein [Candidatus Woesearchaeota archaeon]MDN5327966.1 hypothetical protein [Candidatus Woesearchaeota archaeon]
MDVKISKDRNIIVILILLSIFALIIISPIFKQILSSIILTIVIYPIYSAIKKRLKSSWISALIVVLILILLSALSIFAISRSLLTETYNLFYSKDFDLSGYLSGSKLESLPFYSQLVESSQSIKAIILSKITDLVTSIPSLIFNYIIVLAITFFLLIDGVKGIKSIANLKLIRKKHYNFFMEEIIKITYGIVYGQILVAIVQGFVGGLGIFTGSKLFGISNASPIIWGSLMALSALIPIFGTGLIWGPLSFFRIYQGFLLGDRSLIFYGIFILLWGAIFVANIDGVIRPFFVSSRIKVHPLIVLIGAIGGLMKLGFIGVFVGPLILGLLIKSIDLFFIPEQRK